MSTSHNKSTNVSSNKSSMRSSFGEWYNHRYAFFLFLISLIVAFPYHRPIPLEQYPKIGEFSQQTIIAPFSIPILKSDSAYQREIQNAESSVSPVFSYHEQSAKSVLAQLDTISKNVTLLANKSSDEASSQRALTKLQHFFSHEEIVALTKNLTTLRVLNNEIKLGLSKGILSHIPVKSIAEVEQYKDKYDARFYYIITTAQGITLNTVHGDSTCQINTFTTIPDLYSTLFEKLNNSSNDQTQLASALFIIFDKIVKPTLLYDQHVTSKRKLDARNLIKKTLRTIPKNVEIVRKHQIVTASIAENLDALQQKNHEQFSSTIVVKSIVSQFTMLFLLIILSVILLRSLRKVAPQGVDILTYFNTLALIVAVSFIIIRIGAAIMTSVAPDVLEHSSAIAYTAVPMVIGVLMASALFNKESGVILTIFFSVYGGILGDNDPIIPIGILISGGIVSGLAASMRYRKDFLAMVLWVALTNILIGLTIIFVDGTDPSLTILTKTVLFSITNAVATIAFSFLLLPIFERLFHLTTDMTLMELADMSHPLLKRLAIEAPGTYNHSIMVANLAESAATAIGADGLLCRVVSYYHDIGKLKKPQNFIENQHSKKNIHDKIPPLMSVRIITSHIKEGIELAHQYKLPQAIKDVIPQHHGDGPISFFYHKALEEKLENTDIDINDYCYGGPKPQTRENAVVMIADSVEAASRNMKNIPLKDVRESIRKIIWSKVAQNQFDECGLTLCDLSEIINGMMPILEGIFHSRIDYPEEEEHDDGEVQA